MADTVSRRWLTTAPSYVSAVLGAGTRTHQTPDPSPTRNARRMVISASERAAVASLFVAILEARRAVRSAFPSGRYS